MSNKVDKFSLEISNLSGNTSQLTFTKAQLLESKYVSTKLISKNVIFSITFNNNEQIKNSQLFLKSKFNIYKSYLENSESDLKLKPKLFSIENDYSTVKEKSKFSTESSVEERNILESYVSRDEYLNSLLLNQFLQASKDEVSEVEARLKVRSLYNEIKQDYFSKIIFDLLFKELKNDKFIIGMCLALREFTFNEVYPWGPFILPSLCCLTDNPFIVESTINLIDAWKEKSLVRFLKDLSDSNKAYPNWLESYLSDIILELE